MIYKLIRYRFLFLLAVIVLLILSLGYVSSIKINADVEQFFPTDDPDYNFYEYINTKLQKDEFILLIGIKNNDTLLGNDQLKNIRDFSNSIDDLEHIKKVTGLHNSNYPEKTLFGTVQLPYIDYKNPENIRFNKIRTLKNFDITQNLVTKDFGAFFIWAEIDENINHNQLDSLFQKIDVIKNSHKDLEIYMWGRKFIDQSFKKILIKEIGTLGLWIFIFMCIALLLIFKNPLALIFPIFLIISVVVLFVGGMSMLDRPLGTMSNLFPTIILIVGISDVIHMCIKYNLEIQKNHTASREATFLTIKEIGWTTFITSFTTAIGFFILIISPMKAMRNFGIESGIVVLLTYLLTILLIPTFFMVFKTQKVFAIREIYNTVWKNLLKGINILIKQPNRILIVYLIMILISIFGIYNINTNSHQYSTPKNSSLFNDYSFFEKNFGGSRTFELVLTPNEGYKLNEPRLLKISNDIHNYLSKEQNINSLKSPISYYSYVFKTMGISSDSNFNSALNNKNLKKAKNGLLSKISNNFLYNKENTVFKFSGQINDIGRDEIKILNQGILSDIKTIIGKEPVKAHISGLDHLIDKSHYLSINNMIVGLLLVILAVGIILGIIFRSWALTLLTLILNIVPIILSAGVLGFSGLELRGEISLIFTVGFVIAIDDTIHFLSKFQMERKKGLGLNQAVQKALEESGKAILATSIILIGGFFILLISDSIEIFTLGLIVGIMCIITLTVDLILAPILILNWFKKHI